MAFGSVASQLAESIGWSDAIRLPAGLKDTHTWFLDHQAEI
jgi:hypothetical protein